MAKGPRTNQKGACWISWDHRHGHCLLGVGEKEHPEPLTPGPGSPGTQDESERWQRWDY